MKRPHWNLKRPDPRVNEIAAGCEISILLTQVLLNRKIEAGSIKKFLDPQLSELHSAYLLPDMQRAVERIKVATKQKEMIMIVGDYDVDGITSLAIFNEYIKDFPGTFCYSIPHRVTDGYGLNKDAVERARKNNVTLLICFDCGTNACEELTLARAYGIDTIVIDHHHCSGNTPAYAFVNPKRPLSTYPFLDLSTAALSYKLLQALKNDECADVLDLVALSLVCDVVPLKGENRILLKEGIQRLKTTSRPAIKILCDASKLKQENIDHFHIGFILGPRLNASGRVSSAHEALDIFLTSDTKKINNIVAKLQAYNQQRKAIEADILRQAEGMLDARQSYDYAIVVHGEGWHPGVLGIVASRLADRYYRPAFVISFADKIGKGSARSIHSVHLMESLDKCSQFLCGYGGHRKAAGIQIHKNELESFKERMNLVIKDDVNPLDLKPVLDIDMKIGFKEISMQLLAELELLAPYGEENPQAVFMSSAVQKRSEPKRIANRYSLWLSDGSATFEAVTNDQDLASLLGCAEDFDIVYTLEKNNYHNTPRLCLKDVRLASDPA